MDNNTVAAKTIESWREQTSISVINLALVSVSNTFSPQPVPEPEDCVFDSDP